jgi:hypothetical protein
MNKIVCIMLASVFGMVGTAACSEAFAIYQLADMAGQTEYQVLSKEEFAKLNKEIGEEQKIFSAIVTAAKKEWESNKENKMAFPASKIKARSFKKLSQDFPNKDVASERLAQMEERAAKKIEEDKKDKTKSRTNSKSKSNDPDDAAKEAMKQTMANSAIADVNRRMAEKLGREVPMYGFIATSGKKDAKAPAKAAPAPAKDAKKEEPKKDDAKKEEVKKDDAKKEAEKKPAH